MKKQVRAKNRSIRRIERQNESRKTSSLKAQVDRIQRIEQQPAKRGGWGGGVRGITIKIEEESTPLLGSAGRSRSSGVQPDRGGLNS